jgi:hypothetical protein
MAKNPEKRIVSPNQGGGWDVSKWYVESHVLGGRDALITDDLGLRTMCDRLRDEHGLAVHAESVVGYSARHL